MATDEYGYDLVEPLPDDVIDNSREYYDGDDTAGSNTDTEYGDGTYTGDGTTIDDETRQMLADQGYSEQQIEEILGSGAGGTSGVLSTLGEILKGNLGGALGNKSLGQLLATLGGSALQNRNNSQVAAQNRQYATDWYNMNRASELADMERMGVNKHLTFGAVAPRQQNDMSGVNFSTAGQRPGGLSFFSDVRGGR